jgi:hypothetical protein
MTEDLAGRTEVAEAEDDDGAVNSDSRSLGSCEETREPPAMLLGCCSLETSPSVDCVVETGAAKVEARERGSESASSCWLRETKIRRQLA